MAGALIKHQLTGARKARHGVLKCFKITSDKNI